MGKKVVVNNHNKGFVLLKNHIKCVSFLRLP
jgi:hypothetical protein